MGLVTENWSEWEWVGGVGGRRGFVVTGVRDAAEALADLLDQMGVARGVTHDLDNSIAAEQPVVATPSSPKRFDIQVSYVPVGRLNIGGGGGDLAEIWWGWSSAPREESTDVDAKDRPIVNAAGQPFQSDFTRPYNGRILTARRLEANYRSGVAEDFENSVNMNQVSVARVGTFAPGRLKLLSYEPQEEYLSTGTDPVMCRYSFEVRAGFVQDSDDYWDGFKFRIRNEGFMGWYQPDGDGDPELGDFVTASGERMSEPVLLDKDGLPLDPTIKVMSTKGATNDPIAWPDGPLDDDLIEESASGVVFLKYYRCKVLNFGPLGLFGRTR